VTTATVFAYDGAYLTYSGSSSFYTTAVPTGSTQATVYTTSRTVSLQITWQAI
jgi:ribonuclease T2